MTDQNLRLHCSQWSCSSNTKCEDRFSQYLEFVLFQRENGFLEQQIQPDPVPENPGCAHC